MLIRQSVHRLQQQDLNHHHVVESRVAALRAVGARHGLTQLGAEHREIHQCGDPLKVTPQRRPRASRPWRNAALAP